MSTFENLKYYTSLVLGTLCIVNVFAFLFLVPFVLDPAISTLRHRYYIVFSIYIRHVSDIKRLQTLFYKLQVLPVLLQTFRSIQRAATLPLRSVSSSLSVCSKTTLICSYVKEASANPPTSKQRTIFLMPLTLSVPIFNKKSHWTQPEECLKFRNYLPYSPYSIFETYHSSCLLLKIGSLRAKGIKKSSFIILKVGGSAPAPPTQLRIRVVQLHTKGDEETLFGGFVYIKCVGSFLQIFWVR